MLAILPIDGRLITADAIQTHREICARVIEGGGDYILPVKDNQPTLRADIEAAFAEPEAGLSPPPEPVSSGSFRCIAIFKMTAIG
jgi:hypothetical protein